MELQPDRPRARTATNGIEREIIRAISGRLLVMIIVRTVEGFLNSRVYQSSLPSIGFKRQTALLSFAEDVTEFAGMVDQDVGRGAFQRVRREPIGHSDGIDTGVAGSDYVYVRVADNGGFFRTRPGFFQQRGHTRRVRLLGMKTVATIDLEKVFAQSERVNDSPRWHDGLVAEDSHLHWATIAAGDNRVEGWEDAIVNIGIVQLVLSVIVHEIEQGILDVIFIVGVAKRSSHQHWCTVPDIAGNDLIGQFRLLEMAEHGVDGVGQVQPGVNQGAIQ